MKWVDRRLVRPRLRERLRCPQIAGRGNSGSEYVREHGGTQVRGLLSVLCDCKRNIGAIR
jgi:hypothetical protein